MESKKSENSGEENSGKCCSSRRCCGGAKILVALLFLVLGWIAGSLTAGRGGFCGGKKMCHYSAMQGCPMEMPAQHPGGALK